MSFHIAPRISDICLISRDIDSGIKFYTEMLGFSLRSRMPGFADFEGPGVVLALWDARQLRATTGVPGMLTEPEGRGTMVACELDSPDDVDALYAEYLARGVDFYGPPADYMWNARCVYFAGASGEFWEFFAWHEGGMPGLVSMGPRDEA